MDEQNAPKLRNEPEFTVSELSGAIKRALEDGFGHVRLRGEVSGYRGPHSSGHCYFALKDDKSKIDAVVWKGLFGRLKLKPEEGMEVIVTGKVSSFPGSSKYQIVIEALEPAGAGALMALLEERKRRLGAEGLFEESRKRKLPFLPRVVGIVTSPTGAVIRDMLHGFRERFPTHVIVWPVRVQGEGSAAEVAGAIRGFNRLEPGGRVPRPDVLIVARGGGSLEDLWGFNEEIVVRAAAESRIPLISAVGHETDWTLIDLVADARAPTPTKAAEWSVPKHADLMADIADRARRLAIATRRLLDLQRTKWTAAARGLPRADELVAMPRQRFDAVEQRLARALLANTRAHTTRHARIAARLAPRLLSGVIERRDRRLAEYSEKSRALLGRIAGDRRRRFERVGGRLGPVALLNRIDGKRRDLEAQGKLLVSLSYHSVLSRGFAVVRDREGQMVRSAQVSPPGAGLEIEFRDGRLQVAVTGGDDRGAGPKAEGLTGMKKRPGGSQGSLF
ncbi:MAG: exodeoxyribonuclease VII large subunit [Hyphomicrobium sp.]|nr:exodeoxyribonuclease VII large subunit [Hyphomicrobium sp.]